jgi:predicted DNA-binding transcriptional regulator AlpA
VASAVSADRVRVRVFRGLLRARAPRVRSHVRFITIPVPVFTLNKQNSYLTESNTVYRTTQEKRVPSPRPLGPYSYRY